MILGDYLRLWLETYIDPVRATSTAQGYRQALAHLGGDALGSELDQLQALMIQREINQLAARYSRQAQVLYAVLHCALGRAARMGMVAPGLMEEVDKPVHRKRNMRWLTLRQIGQYLEAAEQGKAHVRLALCAVVGLRRGEALAADRDDVDPARGVLMVRRQIVGGQVRPLKTASSCRDVPLTAGMMQLMMRTQDYGQMSANTLARHHEAALKRAGLPKVTLHELRHSCATAMLQGGAGMVAVQHYLGHSKFDVTASVYAHVLLDDLRVAARVFDGMVGMYQMAL